MEMNTKFQNMPKNYVCENCGASVTAPMHCGHAMHLETVEDKTQWVCWMGTHCGVSDYKPCCDNPKLAPA